jgi:hypothetical protein
MHRAFVSRRIDLGQIDIDHDRRHLTEIENQTGSNVLNLAERLAPFSVDTKIETEKCKTTPLNPAFGPTRCDMITFQAGISQRIFKEQQL